MMKMSYLAASCPHQILQTPRLSSRHLPLPPWKTKNFLLLSAGEEMVNV
jgi:hypothetical protein